MDKNKNDPLDNLDYDVMPGVGNAAPRLAIDVKPAAPTTPAVPPVIHGHWNWRVIGISAAGALLFVSLSLWAYWKYVVNYDPEGESAPSNASNIIVPPPENNTDTDADGLTDSREEELGVDPGKADSDGDGLADGDEVNVYHSDPLLPDTDSDTFQDGQEVKDGYDPAVNSGSKAPAETLKLWEDRIIEFGLHEPTKTTLNVPAQNEQTMETPEAAVYANAVFKYSTAVPNLLEVRESSDKRNVGFRIKGAAVEDEDVTTDPIYITAAVNAGGETLREWVAGQYQPATDYDSLQELKINGIDAIRITGVAGEICDGNKVFVARDTAVIILTWQCNNIAAFGQLFDQIVQSFKWQ
ncbi:MAG: hypothetical protein HY398_01510 [Candidatus Doudnabacteria bacterium]|nr:hypothetical protein [Candidatus Doudnabacteria bacterium]